MNRAEVSVDLDAVRHNCRLLLDAAGPQSSLCAVVKADAYGHGVLPVAQAALDGGATWLAVATAGEALALRAHGFKCPVLVMGALESSEIAELLDQRCDMVVWTYEFLEAIESCSSKDRTARVHIKLDTGMGRLGASSPDLAVGLAARATESEVVELIGLMTHLATADQHQSDFALEQLKRFELWVKAVKEFAPSAVAHAANSAATLDLPDAGFDMVRCGIAIYGLDPFGVNPADNRLRPALSLRSFVASIRTVHAGQSVGYGRGFVAEMDSEVATIPIGYADGVRRSLGGQISVLIRGARVPVVGRVSMDNTSLYLADNSLEVAVGDEVVLIGEQATEQVLVEDWANAAETINYEIVTSIGSRPKRRYFG